MEHLIEQRIAWSLRRFALVTAAIIGLGGTAYADGDLDFEDDLGFGDAAVISDHELADNSGGTEIDIGDIGLNISSNNATLSGNTVDGTVTTGTISNNTLNDVSGINSLMYNTGNNVNFQSNMQVNIFLK